MPRLTLRRLHGPGEDRGAVAPLVAILLASGVLLGITAWVVDLGMLYAERDQVLNAAGATALAAAEQCVRPGSTSCGSVDGQLQSLANANAADGRMSVDLLCGRMLGPNRLSGCPAPAGGAATNCLTTPPGNVSYAEVHTGTLTADGNRLLPPVVARGPGSHVAGCARVAFGPPQGSYAGLGMSECAFDALTGGINDPRRFLAPPPYRPSSTVEQVLATEVSPDPVVAGRPDDCDDLVYYQSDSDNCLVGARQDSLLGGWVDNAAHTTRLPDGCAELLRNKEFPAADDARPYLLMPIYSWYDKGAVRPDGYTDFRIYGIVAFRITGHKLSDADPAPDALSPRLPLDLFCGAGTTRASRCIRGYFVWANIIDGTMPAAGWTTNHGVATYKTVG